MAVWCARTGQSPAVYRELTLLEHRVWLDVIDEAHGKRPEKAENVVMEW